MLLLRGVITPLPASSSSPSGAIDGRNVVRRFDDLRASTTVGGFRAVTATSLVSEI